MATGKWPCLLKYYSSYTVCDRRFLEQWLCVFLIWRVVCSKSVYSDNILVDTTLVNCSYLKRFYVGGNITLLDRFRHSIVFCTRVLLLLLLLLLLWCGRHVLEALRRKSILK